MGDRAAAGVPNDQDRSGGRFDGIDHLDDRVDVVTQGDLGAVSILRLHTGQRERVRAVPRVLESRDDTVPRRAVKP